MKKTQKYTKHKKHIWSFPAIQRAISRHFSQTWCLSQNWTRYQANITRMCIIAAELIFANTKPREHIAASQHKPYKLHNNPTSNMPYLSYLHDCFIHLELLGRNQKNSFYIEAPYFPDKVAKEGQILSIQLLHLQIYHTVELPPPPPTFCLGFGLIQAWWLAP